MSSSYEPPRSGGISSGGTTTGGATSGAVGSGAVGSGGASAIGGARRDPIRDSIPAADQIHGAHDDYPKGEVGSIGALVSDVTEDMSLLMRQEIALAKAEATDSAKKGAKGVAMLAGAALAAFFLLLFLSNALWSFLDNVMGRGWAALIVALLWGLIAAGLALAGRKALQAVRGLPQTTDTAKRVPDALKGNEVPR